MSAQNEFPSRQEAVLFRVLPDAPPAPPAFLRREVTTDGICVLTFDRPGSSANVFDRETLLELNEHLDFITGNAQLKGVVFTSAKPSIFIAGADLHVIAGEGGRLASVSTAGLRELIVLGQTTFSRIAALRVPTIAAIHGVALGGGFELCLACDYRLASPDRATKLGLPETQLGILPAWGGSTRLPRLIGLPKALDLILAGKSLAAKPALKLGLVDALVPHAHLLETATQKILRAGKALGAGRGKVFHRLTHNRVAAALLKAWLKPRLLKKTRGHYPAVLKACEVITQGISQSVNASLALEAGAILELAQTEASRNLIRVFFLQERAKKLTPEMFLATHGGAPAFAPSAVLPPVERTAVVGAGVMGASIAQWLGARGLSVVLRDINAEQVGKGMASIGKLFSEGVKRHTFTRVEARQGWDRIAPAIGETPLQHADLVIEAAVERMDLKQQIFQRLDALAGPKTILATNTSALSITELAASTKSPERVVGIHFFNPVHRMQLVEVVVGQRTSPDVVRRAVRFVQQIGKLPVVVQDSPGFLVNRILMPYLLEAGHLFEHGAQPGELDEAMLEFGLPMGPLRLIDEVGLDVSRHVAETLAASFGAWMHVPKVLGKMLEAGFLGRKCGKGFYLYGKGEPQLNPAVRAFQENGFAATLARPTLARRMSLLMVNEAARCIEEGIVAAPEDVDFAMIMGTGFAPFRGGPLRHADAVGSAQVVVQMRQLLAGGAPHFRPCELLETMSAFGKTFHEEQGG